MDTTKLKQTVIDQYGEIAKQSIKQNLSSCCGAGTCSTVDYAIFSENYNQLEGYLPDADLGLGCGLPTQFAEIKKGDIIVDLGSGAGNDCFVARAITGETGKVIGIDMGQTMIDLARENADKLGFNNVEFRFGDIENIPLKDNSVDVVVSNCVLNLVPDKLKAFQETFRILKPNGHFSISDVVLIGQLPKSIMEASEMYVGCVSGALQKSEYLDIIKEVGFVNCKVQKEKLITLPDDILINYLNSHEIEEYKNSGVGIFSITVYAEKPSTTECKPGSGCCN